MSPLLSKSDILGLPESAGVYLDYAATTPMLKAVWDAMGKFEAEGRGNPDRGLHAFAARAHDALMHAREEIAALVGGDADNVVFTKGTTEGLNLVAEGLAHTLKPGDEILLTVFEHHAMLFPWQRVIEKTGAVLKMIPMTASGELDLQVAKELMTDRVKIVCATHVSNVTGAVLPLVQLGELAKSVGALFVVDAAQSIGRLPVSMRDMKADAVVFGAHKMYGPMGIGVVVGTSKLWNAMWPLIVGGGMKGEEPYRRFGAGTPNVTGAVGFAAAARVLRAMGLDKIAAFERDLTQKIRIRLANIPGIALFGSSHPDATIGIVSFAIDDVHPHDVAQILAENDIAVRAGYHCAEPLASCLHPFGTVRVSIGLTTTRDDIDRLCIAVEVIRGIFPTNPLSR